MVDISIGYSQKKTNYTSYLNRLYIIYNHVNIQYVIGKDNHKEFLSRH